MKNTILKIGTLLLVGGLVIGAVAVWLTPARVEAADGSPGGGASAYGTGQGEPATCDYQPDMQGAYGRRTGGHGAGGQALERGPATANPSWGQPLEDGTYGELSESEIEALTTALAEEYRAWAVYDQVIADLGAVQPFTNIQRAEESHIAALVNLFDRYELEVPANDWSGNVPTFDTLADACAGGVEAEIADANLYDDLFTMVDNPDIIRVFEALQSASLTRHLPAFEQCAP